MKIKNILIFAAGYGTRMLHITKEKPKALIEIGEKPILYYILDRIVKHGFETIYINSHYLAEQIEQAIKLYQQQNPNCLPIQILHEPEILETGGTIKANLDILGEEIFIHNADSFVLGPNDYFTDLENNWRTNEMDFQMLIEQTDKAFGYTGGGDFDMTTNNRLYKNKDQKQFDYIYAGVAILRTAIVKDNPLEKFSLGEYFNSSNLYGTKISGTWCHISCPEDIKAAEQLL